MKLIFSFLFLLLLTFPAFETAQSQSADKIKSSEEQIRQEMLTISKQLGVTCGECHNLKNFASDEKPSFKVSLDHMKLVDLMRERGMDGKRGPEASCYMCHQGQLKYKYTQDP